MTNSRLDNTFRGARNLQFNQVVRGLVGRNDQRDVYRFTTSSSVDFSLAFRGLGKDARVKLLRGDSSIRGTASHRTPLTISKKVGNQSNQLSTTLERGVYYIEVQSVGRQTTTTYSLRASATRTKSDPSPNEPGETGATARNLGVFSGQFSNQDAVSNTDPDYYKFTLAQISDFNATVSPSTAAISLYLDANNNGLIDNSERFSRPGTTITRTVAPGVYFLEVKPSSSSSTPIQYDLAIAATPNPGTLSVDPGDLPATAFNLTSLSATPIKEFVGGFDSRDYYKFTLPQISNLNISIDSLLDSASADADLYFDLNNNGAIDEGELLAEGSEGFNISRAVLPGTYFVEVESSAPTRYDLIVAATPDPGNLSTSPGKSTVTAYDLGNSPGNQILKDYVGSFNNFDYYRFSLNSPALFKARVNAVSFVNSSASMALYRDANNDGFIQATELVDVGSLANNDINRTLQAGVYFLQITNNSNGTRYDLTLGAS
jgi:hypothetical protein